MTSRIERDSSTFVSNLFSIVPSVKKVYKIIQKSTGALGGNGYDGAIYGELTMHSMQKVDLSFLIIYSLIYAVNR